MKYYELQKKMMSWEKGSVFKEEEIPPILLYDMIITKKTSGAERVVSDLTFEYNVDFWKEISEDEYNNRVIHKGLDRLYGKKECLLTNI